jgi:hypothetical protein
VTVGFRGAIAGREVWCCCAVYTEESFPDWQPFVYELEKVCSASDGELFPLVLEGLPVHRVESLLASLELVTAMHHKFRPVVVVRDCFVVLLVYDCVPVAEICKSIFQGWLLLCHKCRVIGLVFEYAGVCHVCLPCLLPFCVSCCCPGPVDISCCGCHCCG